MVVSLETGSICTCLKWSSSVLATIETPDTEVELPTLEKFIKKQKTDQFCERAWSTIGKPESSFNADKNGIGADQKVVQATLRQRVLDFAHHPKIAGHTGEIHMCDTLRKEFYWPHMVKDVYNCVITCWKWPEMGKNFKHERELQLFTVYGPLEFIAMDILGPLPETRAGNRNILVVTDRLRNLQE